MVVMFVMVVLVMVLEPMSLWSRMVMMMIWLSSFSCFGGAWSVAAFVDGDGGC